MKKLRFEPEDFDRGILTFTGIAGLANKRLAKMLEEQGQVVYGYNQEYWSIIDEHSIEPYTHKALVLNVEELEKPKCVHEAIGVSPNFDFSPGCAVLITEWKCSRCGIKLKPKTTWMEEA